MPDNDSAREAREAAREAREQEEHVAQKAERAAKLKREQEEHELEMAAKKKALEKDEEKFDAVQVALLGTFAKLLDTSNEFLLLAKTQFEFKNGSAMRAVACDLIRKAAIQVGTPEALQEAADKLLSVAEAQDGSKKSAK